LKKERMRPFLQREDAIMRKLQRACCLALCLGFFSGCNMPETPLSKVSVPVFRADGHLPDNGFYQDWRIFGKKRWVAGRNLETYIGRQAAMFESYGASLLCTADYGPPKAEAPVLTIESYEMDSALAASGIFHYHRGHILRGQGRPADIGIEGVRGEGVLYFYKGIFFFKIIYTGPDEAMVDLEKIGRAIAADIPGGTRPPRGFEYLSVDGLEPKSSRLSAGYTFNYEFLPPAIFCKAPGAGKIAEVFLIGHHTEDQAERTARDYRFFLEKYGLDYSFKRSGMKRLIWWARDPTHGRVICTQYRRWVIGVLTPQTFERGEVILDRIVLRIAGR
jgi:hypothetical protein